MSSILIAYVVSLIVFGIVDLIWITMVAAPMFKEALRDSLAPAVRVLPAIVFYAMYPAGLVIFAVEPALKSASLSTALLYGGLFGLFTYATYDLTNYATLKGWTLEITTIDIAYGVVVGALVAAVAYLVTTKFSS